MKYYSELLNKNFDTVEECESAEKEEQTRLAEVEKKETALANEKKQLAADIDTAEANLNAAYDKLEDARNKARELREGYEKKVAELRAELEKAQGEILRPARDEVNKAQEEKFKAIQSFNEKYGAYRKVYTGNRAAEEYTRMSRTIDNLFKSLWPF